MAGEENNNQDKIPNSTNTEQNSILGKLSFNSVKEKVKSIKQEVKKELKELKQTIGEKVDIVQDKAGEIYDKVSNEVAESVKPINDVVAENIEKAEKELEEIGKKVDIIQDKAVKIKDTVIDGTVDLYNTTTNYWLEKANSVQKYISDYWNIRGETQKSLADLKQGISTIGTEKVKIKYKPGEYEAKKSQEKQQTERFLQMDLEESSLDILDGTYNPTSEEDKKSIELFKSIKLDEIIEAHNKATSYNDYKDTFETYGKLTEDITKQYIGNEMKNYVQFQRKGRFKNNKKLVGILDPKKPFSNEDVNKLLEGSNPNFVMSPEFKRKLIEKGKARSKELVNKIGYFLRKEKGGEFDNIENHKKKYPNIGALLENKEFKDFIELEKSLFNKDVGFNEFKIKQVEGLRNKLNDTQNQDLASPGLTFDVLFGDTITHKNISLRGENTVDGVEKKDSKKSLYIMGYKYKLDGIKDIESIKIDGGNFIIKGNIYGTKNSEISFSKRQFLEGLEDLIFNGELTLPTTGSKKIFLYKEIE